MPMQTVMLGQFCILSSRVKLICFCIFPKSTYPRCSDKLAFRTLHYKFDGGKKSRNFALKTIDAGHLILTIIKCYKPATESPIFRLMSTAWWGCRMCHMPSRPKPFWSPLCMPTMKSVPFSPLQKSLNLPKNTAYCFTRMPPSHWGKYLPKSTHSGLIYSRLPDTKYTRPKALESYLSEMVSSWPNICTAPDRNPAGGRVPKMHWKLWDWEKHVKSPGAISSRTGTICRLCVIGYMKVLKRNVRGFA